MPDANLRIMPARSINLWLTISASAGASRVVARWNFDRRIGVPSGVKTPNCNGGRRFSRYVEGVRRCADGSSALRRAILRMLRLRGCELRFARVVAHYFLLAVAAAGDHRLLALQQVDVRSQLLAQLDAVGRRVGLGAARGRGFLGRAAAGLGIVCAGS